MAKKETKQLNNQWTNVRREINKDFKTHINAAEKRIGARIDGTDTRIDGMGARIDKVDARIDGIDTKIDGMGTRIDGIDTKIDGIGTRIDKVDARIDGIDTKIDGMGTRIDKVDAKIGGVEERIKVHIGVLVEDFDSKIKLIAEQHSSIMRVLESHTKRLKAIEEKLIDMDTRLDRIENQLKRKVDYEEFKGLMKRVALLESRLGRKV